MAGQPLPFPEFTHDCSWLSYYERFVLFLGLREIRDPQLQVNALLITVGTETYELLQDLCSPAQAHEKTLDELHQLLLNHYQPTRLPPAERFTFSQLQQANGQSISQSVALLRKQASKCGFGANLDERLLDQFISGLRSETVRRRLLGEARLTIANAVTIAQTLEAANKGIKTLQNKPGAAQVAVDNVAALTSQSGYKKRFKGRQATNQPSQKPPQKFGQQPKPQPFARKSQTTQSQCDRCTSTRHRSHECPWKDAECHACRKRGHISRACRSRPGRRPDARAHMVEEVNLDPEPDIANLSIQHVETVCHAANARRDAVEPPAVVTMQLNGKPAEMDLDTGCAKTLLNDATWNQLGEPKLTKPTCGFVSYTGHTVPVRGSCTLTVQYGNQTRQLEAFFVQGQCPSLLGRDWLQYLKLDWHKLFPVRSVQHNSLTQLLSKFEQLFQPGLGTIKKVTAKIQLKDGAQPKFHKARPIPYALREKVEQEIARLVSLGVLEPVSHADWSAPIVPVIKRSSDLRICPDFRATVNGQILVDQYPLPRPQKLFQKLNGGKFFSKLDMSEAYYQILVDPACRHLLTISTHRGLFRFCRVPMGISSAPSIFQKTIETILQGLDCVTVYLDDITVSGRTLEEHLKNLEKVLQRLQEHGIRLRKEKCEFLKSEIHYLGFDVNGDGIRPSTGKVTAIVDMPPPSNASEVKAFISMVTHYSSFLQNLSSLSSPLTRLTQKDVPWAWGKEQSKAFKAIKEALTSMSCTVHFDPALPPTLACDASSVGLGAVLCHVYPDGSERPIAFASKTLTATERRYSQIEKEGYAVIYGIRKFHPYLWGQRFELITDHRPLLAIYSPDRGIPAMCLSRLQRWALFLNSYQYSIRYRATAQHGSADGLSRLAAGEDPAFEKEHCDEMAVNAIEVLQIQELPVTAKQIREATLTDRVLSKVHDFVLRGWPQKVSDPELQPYFNKQSELSVQDGILLWGFRVIIPKSLQPEMLQEIHRAHQGIVKMKSIGRSHMWWPQFDQDVQALAGQCLECAVNAKDPPKSPVQPWPHPQQPWSRIHADFVGPIMGSHYLIVICAYSKWCEIIDMSSGTTASRTISAFRSIFTSQGLAQQLVTDNGPPWQSAEFANFLQANGVQHKRGAPYHPAPTCEAERMIGTFKAAMKPYENARGVAKEKALSQFLLSYRTTVHASTNAAPCQLLNRRQLRTRLDLIHPHAQATAEAKQQEVIDRQKRQTKLQQFAVNDLIWARDYWHKGWVPGRIVAVLGSHNYEVIVKPRSSEGTLHWKRHIDQLRQRHPPDGSVAIQQRAPTPAPANAAAADPPIPPDGPKAKASTPTKTYPIRSRASHVHRLALFNFILCSALGLFIGGASAAITAAPAAKTTASTSAAPAVATTLTAPALADPSVASALLANVLSEMDFLRGKAEDINSDYRLLEELEHDLKNPTTLLLRRLQAFQVAFRHINRKNRPPTPGPPEPVTDFPTLAPTTQPANPIAITQANTQSPPVPLDSPATQMSLPTEASTTATASLPATSAVSTSYADNAITTL